MDIAGQIRTLDQLTALYREPSERALDKEFDRLDEAMRRFVANCPFLVLATTDGAGSVDASPRGGPPGFARCLDDRHLAIPDLNGNNRLDSYRNIVTHGWAGALMITPGNDETLRVNGRAVITTDAEILNGFTKELRTPKAAIVIEVTEVFGHCAKAFRRSKMWQPDTWGALADAPDLAEMYASSWEIDETAMRDILEATYEADLSHDSAD